MKSNIENIVKKALNERYEINKSLRLIIENEETDDATKLDGVLDTLQSMVDDGKSEGEIESSLDEGVIDWITSKFGLGNDKSSDGGEDTSISGGNLLDKGSSGMFSQMREWFIRKGLAIIGFRGPLADAFAASFADLDIRAVIGLFKGGENCQEYGSQVADALIEGMATYMLGGAEDKSVAHNLIRNMVMEYEKASNIGETIAGYLCKMDIRSALTKHA